MGILDGLLGEVTAALGGAAGQQAGLVGSVLSMLAGPQQGGLQGLLQTMKEQGLGGVAASWVGTGPNQGISPGQVQQILGNQKLRDLAARHGLDPDEVGARLAQILPVAVDKMTPGGTLPAAGGLGDLLKGLHPGGNP
jgi:uncharacterized protein YidB (DUF937 family)